MADAVMHLNVCNSLQITTFVFLLTLVTSFSGAGSVGHHPLTAALYAKLPESHREWVHSRLRAAIFVGIFALLFTAACLILDISRLGALMPLHVDKLVSYQMHSPSSSIIFRCPHKYIVGTLHVKCFFPAISRLFHASCDICHNVLVAH